MAEKTEKQPKKISIMSTLLLIALVPTLLTAIMATSLGAIEMSSSLERDVYHELEIAAKGLKEYYEDDIRNSADHQPTYEHEYVDTFKDNHLELTLFLGNTRYLTSIEDASNPTGRNEGTTASDEIWAVVSSGKNYTAHNVAINDGKYYVAYVPVEGADGSIVGMAFAGKDEKLVKSEINGVVKVLVIGAILVVLICSAVVVYVSMQIKKPMEIISSNLEALADGNLGKRPLAHSSVAEIHRIIVARVKLTNALKDIVGRVQSASDELLVNGNELQSAAQTTSSSADGISAAVEDISKGSISMAEDIEDATQKITDMGHKIEGIVSGMVDLNSVAGNMGVAGDNALAIIKALDESNTKTAEAIQVVAENVEATDRSVSDISAAVDLITAIASQTNLLSLNASIEAARAGDAGKGFAVVANEISKLADQSNESGQKIEEVLAVLIADSRRSMEKMTEVQALLKEQQENLRNTEQEFMNVQSGIQNTKQHSGSVDGQAKDCDASRSRVIDIISGLSAISEENAASTEETTASMQELNATINLVAQQAEEVREKAQALEEAMQFFKL